MGAQRNILKSTSYAPSTVRMTSARTSAAATSYQLPTGQPVPDGHRHRPGPPQSPTFSRRGAPAECLPEGRLFVVPPRLPLAGTTCASLANGLGITTNHQRLLTVRIPNHVGGRATRILLVLDVRGAPYTVRCLGGGCCSTGADVPDHHGRDGKTPAEAPTRNPSKIANEALQKGWYQHVKPRRRRKDVGQRKGDRACPPSGRNTNSLRGR